MSQSTSGDEPRQASTGTTAGVDDAPAEQVMDMLSEHVPLSLLMDLTVPEGPNSAEILDEEGSPEDAWWEQESS